MKLKAYLTAFHHDANEPVKIRPIRIPDERLGPNPTENDKLNLAFEFGQNDFQPFPGCYSVSVGDVIELDTGALFRVLPCGFGPLEPGETPTAKVGIEAHRAAYKVF